ncbi:hypothetical protein [Pseudorhodobacter ferrugineus]|uniref:hypothetical protein n=1 Tax=Pseudorhodobacter ferrugineus TaxID=77008 RepID=UPI000AC1274C|nr:hypothetical protein [Pseudorhodobacter ferrugineus]
MTYEVDGSNYYFPAYGSFFGVLPIGIKAKESWFSKNYSTGSGCCTVWWNLSFDLYLETGPDNRIERGFGLVNEYTDLARFGYGARDELPNLFGISTGHPSGPLRYLDFYISSRNSQLDKFRLENLLPAAQITGNSKRTWVSTDMLSSMDFESFNDAFWVIEDNRYLESPGGWTFNGLVVVSKFPILNDRHVYGRCDISCSFSSLKFPDEVDNEEPLLTVEMHGADIDVLGSGLITRI